MRHYEKDGSYTEITYYDANHNYTDSKNATHCIIREYSSTGEPLMETYGICNAQKVIEDKS